MGWALSDWFGWGIAESVDFIGVYGGCFEKMGLLLVDFIDFGKKCGFAGRFHVSCGVSTGRFECCGRMGRFVRVGRGKDGEGVFIGGDERKIIAVREGHDRDGLGGE